MELVQSGSTITATTSSVTAGVRTIDLNALGGTWYPNRPVSIGGTNVFVLYHPGVGQPDAYTVTFTTTPSASRDVPLAFAHPTAASVRFRVGSATQFTGSATCSGICSALIRSPLGAQSFSYDYLDGSGNMLASSLPTTLTIQ